MDTPPSPGNEPEILFHLRWVAKIALSVGAIAAAGLAVALYVLADSSGITYWERIQSHSIVHSYLGPTLLISGCLLVAFISIVTWLITLYSSFRIAGPLFRFSRNLETAIAKGPRKPIPIREGDRLLQDAVLLGRSLAALESHYADLRDEVELAIRQTEVGEIDQTQLAAAKLMQLVERVRV